MGKPNVDLKKLTEQSNELYSLIRATNGVLQDPAPISELRVDYEEKVSDLAPQVLQFAKMAVATRRNPRQMLVTAAVGVVAATVGWAGAAGIDAVRNKRAKAHAEKALLGYYQQLSVKQSMIIDEQQRINAEMSEAIDKLSENEVEYREKIRTLQARQTELGQLLHRFNSLKQQVES